MADDPNAQPASAAPTTDLGGTNRVTTSSGGEPNPSLEEQNAAQEAEAAKKPGAEATPEAGKEGEQPPKEEGAEPEKKPGEGVDLKGTIFEGTSPEMQAKVAPYAAAFAENGTLTDAEVTEAAQSTGFSEAAVRQFMAGAQATANDTAASAAPVFDAFKDQGGVGGFKEFQAWTNADPKNLTPAETRSINKALGVGADGKPLEGVEPDYETAAQLMAAPRERWLAAGGGNAARDVTEEGAGGGGGGNEGDVYGSWAEATKDQSSKEYRENPAFRDKVIAKIGRSKALG